MKYIIELGMVSEYTAHSFGLYLLRSKYKILI